MAGTAPAYPGPAASRTSTGAAATTTAMTARVSPVTARKARRTPIPRDAAGTSAVHSAAVSTTSGPSSREPIP
jgi:hypothetical protein